MGGFTPGSVQGLVAAFASDYGVTNGGANVAGAYGTSRTLSVPSGGTAPTVDALGVESNQALLYASAGKSLQISSDIVFTGAFTIYWSWRADHASGTRTVVGRDTNNQEAIRMPIADGTTNVTPTFRVCTTTAYSLALGRPLSPGAHYGRLSRDGSGVLTVYIDGEQVGTQSGHTGNSTWSSIGYNATGSNPFAGLIGEVLFFDESASAISAASLAALDAYMERRWRSAFYMDPAGSDSNDGSRLDRARKTLSALNALPFRPAQRFVLADDAIFDGDAIYFDANTTTASTSSSRPWTISRSNTGSTRPKIRQREVIAGPWSLVTGTIYKATVALTVETTDGENILAGRVTNGATVSRIYTATSNAPALNQQFYDGTDLYLNVGADPTGMTVEVATRGAMATTYTNAGIRIARGNIVVDGIDVDLFPGNSIRIGHANNGIVVRNFVANYAALDGFNIAAGQQTVEDGVILYPGRRFDGSGSAGDGITAHGSSGATVRRLTVVGAGKGGIANEQAAVMSVSGSSFTGCYLPAIMLAQGTAGTGSLTIDGCVFDRPANAGQDDAIMLQASLPVGNTLTVTNTTFTGLGTTRGKVINNLGGIVVNQSGNSQTGFLSIT